jgi:TPP-dependent pyruvate/acetoin dehydrogenase alpha subunit
VKKWKEKDPIKFLMDYMKQKNLLTPQMIQELDNKVEQELQEAISFAEGSEQEPLEDLEKHLYENDL